MDTVRFFSTITGKPEMVTTITFDGNDLIIEGQPIYADSLFEEANRENPDVVLALMKAAPLRFDGSYLRAEYEGDDLTRSDAKGNFIAIDETQTPVEDDLLTTILSLDAKATSSLTALATAIADRAGGKATAEDIQRELLEPWLTSVFGTPMSNQMQKVAARTFGFPDPPGTEELKINWQLLYPMGELYNITQEYLKTRGFNEWETVPVYHPYVPSEARPKQWQKGDEVRIKLLPLTSWTLDVREAAKVAEFMGAPGSPAFVLKTFIPIKSVVSTPNTGIGLPGTQEIVLAGGEYEAILEQRYE